MNKKNIVTALAGIIIVGILAVSRGVFSVETTAEVFFILSDSCVIPGILFICIGLLIMVGNQGLFNGVSYGFKSIKDAYAKTAADDIQKEEFYEYAARKAKNKMKYGHLILVGILLVILSVIFAFIG